jgi:2-polyprenyl-6-methoxyphenol hydroxylase-like FAD-dependent oxidoreductase
VPHSSQLHALLGGGQRALGELFPGFEQDLAVAGAVPLRAGLDLRFQRDGDDPFPQRDLGWPIYAMSRPLTELAMRRRVEQHTNITLRQRCRALEFVASADGAAVVAVRCETIEGIQETLETDLIVDASSRGSATLALLESIGRGSPEETRIGVHIGYVGAIFAIPDDAPSDWKALANHPAAPKSGRGCFLMPVEGNRCMVALSRRRDDWPPADGDEFLAFAREFSTPTLYNAIKHAKRQGGIKRYGFRRACGGTSSGSKLFPADCFRSATSSVASTPSTARK